MGLRDILDEHTGTNDEGDIVLLDDLAGEVDVTPRDLRREVGPEFVQAARRLEGQRTEQQIASNESAADRWDRLYDEIENSAPSSDIAMQRMISRYGPRPADPEE